MMTAPVDDVVSFSCPVIAPKVYIVKGPSGWIETFERRVLDPELTRFVAPIQLRELVDLFISARETADKPEPTNWHTIVGFIGRTLGVSPRAIPPTVGVAFWAHVEIAKRERVAN